VQALAPGLTTVRQNFQESAKGEQFGLTVMDAVRFGGFLILRLSEAVGNETLSSASS